MCVCFFFFFPARSLDYVLVLFCFFNKVVSRGRAFVIPGSQEAVAEIAAIEKRIVNQRAKMISLVSALSKIQPFRLQMFWRPSLGRGYSTPLVLQSRSGGKPV